MKLAASVVLIFFCLCVALKVIKTFNYAEGENLGDWHAVMEKMEKHYVGSVTA